MKMIISRKAAYELADALSTILEVDRSSRLNLHSIGISTEGNKDGYVNDDLTVTPEFCEIETDGISEH